MYGWLNLCTPKQSTTVFALKKFKQLLKVDEPQNPFLKTVKLMELQNPVKTLNFVEVLKLCIMSI